jgi:hypothetical protein
MKAVADDGRRKCWDRMNGDITMWLQITGIKQASKGGQVLKKQSRPQKGLTRGDNGVNAARSPLSWQRPGPGAKEGVQEDRGFPDQQGGHL